MSHSSRSSSVSDLFSLRSLPTTATLALANGLILGGTAQAQTNAPAPASGTTTNAPAEMPKVVVTGQAPSEYKAETVSSPRYTQPLRDTPQTIAVVPKAIIEQQGATTLSDVLRNTPGITFAAGEGGNVASGDSFYMRGVDTSGNVFVDGVRDTGGYSRDTFNLEQVEIFKGPTGADNGRGGGSGYVNMATKKPTLDPFYNASVQYGSADQVRTTLDLNQPLNLGEKGDWLNGSSLRLNSMWQNGSVPGRDHVETDRWGIAPSLGLGLGTDTRLIFTGSFVKQDGVPDSGLPFAAMPGGPAGDVDQDNFYGLANEDFDKVESGRFSAIIERDLNDSFTLRSQSSWARTERDALTTYFQNSATSLVTFNPTNTPINPATGLIPDSYVNYDPVTGTVTPRRIRNQTENEIFLQQIGLNGTVDTGPIGHQLGVGADYSHETQYSPTWSAVGGPATSLTSPDADRTATAAQTPYIAANNPFGEGVIDTVGIYAFDTVTLHEKWILNGSLRLEHYDVRYRSLAPATIAAPSPVVTQVDGDGNLVSWKAGPVFKPLPNGSIYFSYANSFTPPGSAFNLSATANNQNNPNLDPQEARNFEVGTKWDFFEGKLSTSLALYHSENLNIVSTDATTGLVTQDIDEKVNGVEVGVSGELTRNWFVYGGFGFADGERNATGTTSAATQDGADLRFLPSWSSSLWTGYKLPFGVTIGGGFQYSGAVNRSTSTTLAGTTLAGADVPSYVIFNSMVSYEATKHLTLRLNVNNIFDEETYRLNNNGGRYYPGTPRSFLLTADMRF